jgi:cellobiose dehydrogenase (acceptor)
VTDYLATRILLTLLALRPESGWLDGQNLTWFDIPGECNRIWNGGSPGVACTDLDQMAGCVLGGGAAVNAGLWWKVCSFFVAIFP